VPFVIGYLPTFTIAIQLTWSEWHSRRSKPQRWTRHLHHLRDVYRLSLGHWLVDSSGLCLLDYSILRLPNLRR
jgi:hypothetical protein